MKTKKIKKIVKIFLTLIKYYYYKLYCSFFKIRNDDVWIISERGIDARDNSYHLFKYIRKNHPDIIIKYVIDKKSPDYKKVCKYGETIQYGSKEHYILFITANVLISTHDMGYSPDMSLFTRLNNRGLLKINGKKIYIQHGINKDVIHVPKCDLTITGGYPEYLETIKSYPDIIDRIKYTGLARFDNLPIYRNEYSHKILFMPTFRKWLVYLNDNDFKKSIYYTSIQNLLNNDRLLDILRENNYELIFYPHIEMQERVQLFSSKSDLIKIASFNNYDVQQLLIDSDLLITDFSSVFFDFAYMNKPVIFFQFDQDEYRSKHYQEGYFSYENDGFGEVVLKPEDLIVAIEKELKSNCIVPLKYKKRKEKYFKHCDNSNCKRIYDEIKKI